METPTLPQKTTSYWGPLAIIGALFFVFGFVTWVNSVLIAFFKQAFQLSTFSSNLVAFAFFISYTLMAIPSSWVLRKTGFKNGMSVGLAVMAVGTLIFVPAASAASYPLFLVGLFLIGIGLTVLQTASNPYVTILGPRQSAAQRISFMGVANKVAGILAQFLIGGLLLTGATAVGTASLSLVVTPYLIITGILIVLAVLIRFSTLPEVSDEQDPTDALGESNPTKSIAQHPNLVLGVAALFAYVGAEVITGDTIINYGKLTNVGPEMAAVLAPLLSFLANLGISFDSSPAKLPNYLTVLTLISLMLGYITGIVAIPRFISQQNALRWAAILGIVFSGIALATSGWTSVLFIGLAGFANAPIWPAIWPLALDRLGKFTKLGSALLIMGISGGAVLPLLHGYLTDAVNPKFAYVLLLPLYLFILYYAVSGHKKRTW